MRRFQFTSDFHLAKRDTLILRLALSANSDKMRRMHQSMINDSQYSESHRERVLVDLGCHHSAACPHTRPAMGCGPRIKILHERLWGISSTSDGKTNLNLEANLSLKGSSPCSDILRDDRKIEVIVGWYIIRSIRIIGYGVFATQWVIMSKT